MNGSIVVGNSVLQADGKLLVQRDGYTLALAYRATHASGVGRFIELFRIPWLNPDPAWACSGLLTFTAQPATSTLQFRNIVINTSSAEVRSACNVPLDKHGAQQRWYGGYFSLNHGFFIEDRSGDCKSKAYSLTTSAEMPAELPAPDDSQLNRIKLEAIAIVGAITYKACAPRR